MISRAAVFTGHRDVRDGHAALISRRVLEVCNVVDEFVVGGADGADTIALDAVCDLTASGAMAPHMVVIVPDFASSQSGRSRESTTRAVELGAELIELRLGLTPLSYKSRNRAMVDRVGKVMRQNGYVGSLCLAYWNGIYRSGTYHAISYSESLCIPISYVVDR